MKNKHSHFFFNITILAYILYFLQGALYARGSMIPMVSVVIILFADLWYLFKTLQKGSTKISVSILAFVSLMSISWYLSPKYLFVVNEMSPTYGELKNIYLFLMAYFPFKWWIDTGLLDMRKLRKLALAFFVLYVVGFFVKQYEAINAEFWKENVTNNGGYMIPLVFPLLTLFIRDKRFWMIISFCVLLTLLSAKRGAIVCMLFECLVFLFYKLRDVRLGNKIWVITFFVVLSVVALHFVEGNVFLMERFSSDSSGRDDIYRRALIVYSNGDLTQQLFGYGFCQSIVRNYMYAHSDWFELIVDNGILGIVIYALIFLCLLVTYYKRIRNSSLEFQFMYVAASSCWLIKSLFSMGYNSPEACMLMIAIAIAEGSRRRLNLTNK